MNDVIHTVTDGLTAMRDTGGTGVHIKIGASPVQDAGTVLITGAHKSEYITKYLGLSPLRDAVMDSVENGSSKIICIPVMPSAKGTVNALEPVKADSSGAVSVDGNPNNSFGIVIRITGKGTLNTGAFKYSINGGYTFSEESTIPLTGKFELPDTGLTATFTPGDGQGYEVDDTYSWQTTAPKLTNEDVLKGLDQIKGIRQEAELVHVVGECTADTWAMVSAAQTELQERYHKPLMFVLEAFKMNPDESADDYVAALKEARKTVKNYQLQVVASRLLYAGMDGLSRDTNAAGIICGLYARTAVHRSIGETAMVSIGEDKASRRLPECLDDDNTDDMDGLGYLTIRQYDGLEGYYVNNARMMGPEGTDYRYAEDVRVLNKIIRETRKTALLQLQTGIDLEKPEADLKAKVLFIQAPLDTMVTNGEISSAEVSVPEDAVQTVITDGTLRLTIRYVQRGIIRSTAINVGRRNPYAS